MNMKSPHNEFFITANFYIPGETSPSKTWELNWNNRDDVREFATAANTWLRNGSGYRVETSTN